MNDVNIEETRAIAARAGDWFAPVFAEENKELFPVSDPEVQSPLSVIFQSLSGDWSPHTEDEAIEQVFSQFCRLLPRTGLVSVVNDPATVDFHWSKVRCILAGAGHKLFPKFARILINLYPQCPFVPDESYEDWAKHTKDAHRMSGWPISVGLAEWDKLKHVLPQVDKDNCIPSQWTLTTALLHLLKHMRISRVHGAVITFRGTEARFELDEGINIPGGKIGLLNGMMLALGAPQNAPKKSHPLSMALRYWLTRLCNKDYLERKSTHTLPKVVLSGEWSTTTPDPTTVHGFVQHGLSLTGVWVAQQGTVTATGGESADVVGYDWSLNPPDGHVQRLVFEASLPATYDDTQTPHELLKWGFPNWTTANFKDEQAAGCLFDALMCASMIQDEVPALAGEKAFILCMPTEPSIDLSTNQGKTRCAKVIARVFSPSIRVKGIPDGDAAPNMRAIASDIERDGTLCVDEWRQPKARNHILNHENLQMLMTGGTPAIGKAYENASSNLTLRYHLTGSCKMLDAPPDIVSRAFVVLMDNLTDEQLARTDALEEVDSGKLSIRIRLATLAMCERMDLINKLKLIPHDTSKIGWRFNCLRAIAKVIWTHRHGNDGAERLDMAIHSMQLAFNEHYRQAQESGLAAALEAGESVKVHLHSLFAGMTTQELTMFIVAAQARMGQDRHGFTPTALLKARATQLGMEFSPLSRLMEHMAGERRKVGDRTMACALAREIRGMMPKEGSFWILPELLGLSGWRLIRKKDVNQAPRVEVQQIAPAGFVAEREEAG